MNKSIKSQFKVKKVRRCLRFAGVPSKAEMYEVWKVTGPRGLVKYFNYKYKAMEWIKKYTTQQPLTMAQMRAIIIGK